ncbi:hypothetical protein ARMA_1359 [Ardenticatena maritima]|uniref:Uncharacterized protein n=1 Tax=Ardenticatena maritima TaxID=872965 RepID=A0A0M8K9B9_9CHLR|nr:hypothetical protein ARMA_1359 [Ardenticatena maritima]
MVAPLPAAPSLSQFAILREYRCVCEMRHKSGVRRYALFSRTMLPS